MDTYQRNRIIDEDLDDRILDVEPTKTPSRSWVPMKKTDRKRGGKMKTLDLTPAMTPEEMIDASQREFDARTPERLNEFNYAYLMTRTSMAIKKTETAIRAIQTDLDRSKIVEICAACGADWPERGECPECGSDEWEMEYKHVLKERRTGGLDDDC